MRQICSMRKQRRLTLLIHSVHENASVELTMLVTYTLYTPPHVSSVHLIRTAYGGRSNKS